MLSSLKKAEKKVFNEDLVETGNLMIQSHTEDAIETTTENKS
jgi:hypothetical protein